MRFNKAWTTLCEVLLMSSAFKKASAAAILKQRSLEIQLLTGTALSEALSNAKLSVASNLTIPNRRSYTPVLHERDPYAEPVCANDFACSILSGVTPPGATAYGTESGVFADLLVSTIQSAATLNQDLPGDAAQSFYVAATLSNYQLITQLLTNGVVQAYLVIANSGIFLNSIISLADVNAILPYCDDTTYDAVASRIASLVDAFLTQYNGSEDPYDASPTVVAANIDADTGEVDGISIGASFVLASAEQEMSQICPVFGDYW